MTIVSVLIVLAAVTLGGFAVTFYAIYKKNAELAYANYFGHAFTAVTLAFLADALIRPYVGPFWGPHSSYPLFGVSVYFIVRGIFLYYNHPLNTKILAAVLVGLQLCMTSLMVFLPQTSWGLLAYEQLLVIPFSALLIPAWKQRNTILDKVLFGTFLFGVLNMLVQPAMVAISIGTGLRTTDFEQSFHVAAVYFSTAFLAIPLGIVLIIACGTAIIHSLKKEAVKDGLTGLLNPESFLEEARSVVETNFGKTSLVTYLICSIDGLDDINKRYGPTVADAVLRNVGALVQKSCRENDFAGRLGDQEFGIVLQTANRKIGELVASGICANVGLLDKRPMDKTITLSIGMATTERNERFAALQARAQRVLEVAKKDGFDRIVVATEAA